MGAEQVFGLARHLTERDREIALRLDDQPVLTTNQLRLLFFPRSVGRRIGCPSCTGPDRRFLVAAMLGLERQQLGWQRGDDWASYPQLAHRMEANRFVTGLIAATPPEPSLG